MKTLTLKPHSTGRSYRKRTCIKAAKILIACLFAARIALSDTLGSSVQYSAELEKKQNSLTTIKEDIRSIEDAFKHKTEERGKIKNSGRASPDRLVLPGMEISALLPAAPQPGFGVHAAPYGTLTPRGNTGVVDRGFGRDEEGKR